MSNPTVLHVTRDWVRSSEGFVSGFVGATRATRPVVVCGRRVPGPADAVDVRVRVLGGIADPDAWRARDRRLIRGGILATAMVERAALLHAHFGYWASHAARVAEWTATPWLLSLHGHDLLVFDRDAPGRAVVRRANLTIVPSEFFRRAALDAGFADESVRVLPSGVDLATLPWRSRTGTARRGDGPDVVTVTIPGRWVAKKGIVEAVTAVGAAQRELPAEVALRCVVVGSGPLEPQVRAAATATGMAVEWVDGAQPGAVADALQRTDLAVVASRTAADGDAESLGLVAIEAQACGVPLVATRHGGLPEAIAPGAALLVDEADDIALSRAILELVMRPERWPAMSLAGRGHVESRFELGACTQAVEAAYGEVLRAKRSGPGRN